MIGRSAIFLRHFPKTTNNTVEAVMKSMLPQVTALAALALTTICSANPVPGATGVRPFNLQETPGTFAFPTTTVIRYRGKRRGS